MQYNNEDDINPRLLDLDFANKEEDQNKRAKKANKKEIDNNEDNNERQYSKKERILIKKIKKAFHKLRVVIRAYKKRKKNTFNPDLQVREDFQNWLEHTFPEGLEKYRELKMVDNMSYNTNNSKMNKKKKKNKNDVKEKKLKNIIKLINQKNDILYEDEEYIYNCKKKYFYKWYDIFNNYNYKESKNKKALKKNYTDTNYHPDLIKKKSDNKNQTEYIQPKNKTKKYNKNYYNNYKEKNEYPIIRGNEYSDADSNKDEDDIYRDKDNINLTKSQEIVNYNQKYKEYKTKKQSKTIDNNDNDEFDDNQEDFYNMNVVKKKKKKNRNQKLFNKIYDNLENKLKDKNYKENKKINNDDDNMDEDEMDYIDNDLEINSRGNTDQKKKRIKILKENEKKYDYNKKYDEKDSMNNSYEDRDKNDEKEKEKERIKKNKKTYYAEKDDEEDYGIPRKEQQQEKKEKKEKEKEHNDIYHKNNQNILSDSFNSTSQHNNNYGTPKKLPMYDPYKDPSEVQENPKVQAPRQVLELEKLKGKSKLPDIQRASSYSRKKYGLGNLDYVEPGELVSNTKLKLLNNMLSGRKSDFGLSSRTNLKNHKNEKHVDFNLSADSRNKFDSEYEEKIIKKLTKIIKNINDLKLLSKTFKSWKNFVKKEMSNTRITMLDCAPPPKKEKKSATVPVIFLSKSITEVSNNDDYINNEEQRDKSFKLEKKESPLKRHSDGRYEFILPKTKEFNINRDKEDNQYMEHKNEEEEEIEEEFEAMSDKDFNNYFNNKAIKKEKNKNNVYYSKKKQQSPYKKNVNKNNVNKENNKDNNKLDEENNFKEEYNALIPEIELYKLNNNGNRIKNNIMNLIRNTPSSISNGMNPQTFLDITKKLNKYYTAYQIYILYSLFNMNHQFYDKRRIFSKLKALSNLKPSRSNNNSEFLFYDCENNDHCKGCFCFYKRNKYTLLKKIVMKYSFMKEYNPMKYFLNYWYKITFF